MMRLKRLVVLGGVFLAVEWMFAGEEYPELPRKITAETAAKSEFDCY